jgi:hypothetical protein
MAVVLQVDFPYAGPWGEAMHAQMADLAVSIAGEPGLIWKIWTEQPDSNQAGGIYLFQDQASAQAYLFQDQASAQAYLDMHRARLAGFGVPQVNAKLFQVNRPLSLIDRAPL